MVEGTFKDAADPGMSRNVMLYKGCEEAFRVKAYSVFGAALRTTLEGDIAVMDYVFKIPIDERKAILMSALGDDRVWPITAEEWKFRAMGSMGKAPQLQSNFESAFRRCISETFGVPAEYPEYWSKADRADLAAKIRGTGDPAIPPKPPEATAPPSATQPAPTIPAAPAPTAATQSPNDQATKGMGPVFWAAIGIAVMLAGAWLLKRR